MCVAYVYIYNRTIHTYLRNFARSNDTCRTKGIRRNREMEESNNSDTSLKKQWAERVKREQLTRKRLKMRREQRKREEEARGTSKQRTSCREEYRASLDCIENYGRGSNICERSFAIYEDCIKKERELRLAANALVGK